jgi:hypothetical protein
MNLKVDHKIENFRLECKTEYGVSALDLKQFAITFVNYFELGQANVKLCFVLEKKIRW